MVGWDEMRTNKNVLLSSSFRINSFRCVLIFTIHTKEWWNESDFIISIDYHYYCYDSSENTFMLVNTHYPLYNNMIPVAVSFGYGHRAYYIRFFSSFLFLFLSSMEFLFNDAPFFLSSSLCRRYSQLLIFE